MNYLGYQAYQTAIAKEMVERDLKVTTVGILITATESLRTWHGIYRLNTKIINNGLTYLIIRRVELEIGSVVVMTTSEEITLLSQDLSQPPSAYYHGFW